MVTDEVVPAAVADTASSGLHLGLLPPAELLPGAAAMSSFVEI